MSTDRLDLTDRFMNQPAFIAPHMADRMKAGFVKNSSINIDVPLDSQAAMFDKMFNRERPYRMVGSVAVIPITGSLLHRCSWGSSWATGYDYITLMRELAEKDSGVDAIAFDFHTGGGQVDGAFECAAGIYECSKPTIAIINAHAYSAGYLLASACRKRAIAATGGAGSIGVVTMHADYSEAMKQWVNITFIFKGDHKIDGNPYEPLPDTVKARYQERIDSLYSKFTETVSVYTGLSVDAVVSTQAECFTAAEALNLGLVDMIEDPKKALKSFVADNNGVNQYKDLTMSKQDDAVTIENGVSKAEHESAVEKARNDGFTEGANAERERFSAVLSNDNFAGREALAVKLLSKAAMSAEDIIEALAEVPAKTQQTGAEGNAFQDAMDSSEHPETESAGDGPGEQMSDADKILKDYGMSSGSTLN